MPVRPSEKAVLITYAVLSAPHPSQVPIFLSSVPQMMKQGLIGVDVVFIQVSPPGTLPPPSPLMQ